MALLIIHQHRVGMMINSKTTNHFSNRHLILKARPSFTPDWMNPSIYHPRITRVQEATESTQEFRGTAVDLVITIMNLRHTKRASNSSKYREAQPQLQARAISSQVQENGIFHLIIHTTPTSIPLIITQLSHIHTTDTIISKTSWTWTSRYWTTTVCCRTTITIMGSTVRCVELCCRLGSVQTVSRVSPALGRFSCGSSYSNFSPTNPVKASSHGLAMDGSLSWLIPMR